MSHQPNVDPAGVAHAYSEQIPIYKELANRVQLRVQAALQAKGIAAAYSARAKDLDSLLGKMARKQYASLDKVGDRAGVRIVLRSGKDIADVAVVISDTFIVRSEEDASARLKNNEFDYRGYHFQVSLRSDDCDEILGSNIQCEIQLRTRAEDLWNDVSHELLYKSARKAPDNIARRLHRLVALVEIFDEQVDAAREEITSLSDDAIWAVLSMLEDKFNEVTFRSFDRELSFDVVEVLMPVFGTGDRDLILQDISAFCDREKEKIAFIMETHQKSKSSNPFIVQPTMSMIALLLKRRRFEVQTVWRDRFPEEYLLDIASKWSIDLPDNVMDW